MKKVYLTKKSHFDATHSHKGALKEKRHKHIFHYEVTLYGTLNKEGFLIDFRQVEKVLNKKINEVLKNRNLNLLIPHPTTENIAFWIYEKLKPVYKNLLCNVRVYETKNSSVTYQR